MVVVATMVVAVVVVTDGGGGGGGGGGRRVAKFRASQRLPALVKQAPRRWIGRVG